MFKNLLLGLKKHFMAFVLAIAALAVLGVGYFDTYPTYFAQRVILSEIECEQVATLVAAQAYISQNPGSVLPKQVQEILDNTTRLARRVAKYIINKDSDVVKHPPPYLFSNLHMSCMMAGGKANLS